MAYGTLTALVAGVATLTKPAAAYFLYIMNKDVAPLHLTFTDRNAVQIGTITLAAAATQDTPGGYLDSILFPVLLDAATVALASTVATAHVACGYSMQIPRLE